MARLFDPTVFADSSIAPETAAFNAEIIARLDALPDQWDFPPAVVRERRKQGLGAFPPKPLSDRAKTIEIDGPAGPIALRILEAENPRGVFMHIHGGGWVFGGADEQDPYLEVLADRCGLTAVSVEYRLAPEDPYPAAPDDCEAAALWLVQNAEKEFGAPLHAIGGESAGAHLSVVTLLRLRDEHGLSPFQKANLVAGCFDLGLTPSARRFGDTRLVLRTKDVLEFAQCFLDDRDRSDPDISPLYADLSGMPEALFSVGTKDALVDDTLFMGARWLASGNGSTVKLYPGGAHVFQAFPIPLAEESLADMIAFLGPADA
ncbi:MAG: alpha/beta hydrolase [Pseudomonadota bacterium]